MDNARTDFSDTDVDVQRGGNEIGALKADLAAVKDDLRTLADSFMGRGREKMSHLRGDVEDRLGATMDKVQQCVEERPLTTLFVAFGAGLILSRLMSHK